MIRSYHWPHKTLRPDSRSAHATADLDLDLSLVGLTRLVDIGLCGVCRGEQLQLRIRDPRRRPLVWRADHRRRGGVQASPWTVQYSIRRSDEYGETQHRKLVGSVTIRNQWTRVSPNPPPAGLLPDRL